MKTSKADIDRALAAPPADIRLFLLYGPDDSGSRALARKLGIAMGEGAERVDLAGSELKGDPARLADEAAAMSLFGDRRYVVVEAAGDEVVPAVEALLEAPGAGNPVAIVAGNLKGTSKLVKLAMASKAALAFASYVPDARDAVRISIELGHEQGLTLRPDVARRIADAAGGNRAIMAQELAKFALYLDVAPERPGALDHDAIDAVGAAAEEGELGRLVDSVAGGDAAGLQAELLRLRAQGIEGIPLIRAMLRRMSLLTSLRAEVEAGSSVGSVMAAKGRAIFWKEKDSVGHQLGRWRADLLAKATERLLDAERAVKAPGGLGPIAVDEELFAICRQAARLR